MVIFKIIRDELGLNQNQMAILLDIDRGHYKRIEEKYEDVHIKYLIRLFLASKWSAKKFMDELVKLPS